MVLSHGVSSKQQKVTAVSFSIIQCSSKWKFPNRHTKYRKSQIQYVNHRIAYTDDKMQISSLINQLSGADEVYCDLNLVQSLKFLVLNTIQNADQTLIEQS